MAFKNRLLIVVCFVALILIPLGSPAQNEQEAEGSRNDFKVTLLSLGSGSSRFTYERAFSKINSAEFTIGIIGWGWDWMNESDPHGLLTKLAFKWRLIPQSSSDSWLAGFYVKPELVVAAFRHKWLNQDSWGEIPKDPDRTNQVALLVETGYQLVLNWFVFDVYAGLGPSFGSGNPYNYFHSFMLFPKDGWLAFTAGFRLGVAF